MGWGGIGSGVCAWRVCTAALAYNQKVDAAGWGWLLLDCLDHHRATRMLPAEGGAQNRRSS